MDEQPVRVLIAAQYADGRVVALDIDPAGGDLMFQVDEERHERGYVRTDVTVRASGVRIQPASTPDGWPARGAVPPGSQR